MTIKPEFSITETAAGTTRQPRRRRNGGVQSIKPDPILWRAALRLARGDTSRLETQRDHSVIVWNHPRRKS